MPRAAALRLELIAEELFINVAEHGGQGAGGTVSLAVRDAGPEVELVMEDRAVAFDPFAGIVPPSAIGDPDQRPVGGLGRALVAGLSSRSHYRRLDGHNQVTVGVRKASRTGRAA